jgi:hypothetical protein
VVKFFDDFVPQGQPEINQRRSREIFVEPKTQNKSSSVGAAYSDVAPTELIYFRNFFYNYVAPTALRKIHPHRVVALIFIRVFNPCPSVLICG